MLPDVAPARSPLLLQSLGHGTGRGEGLAVPLHAVVASSQTRNVPAGDRPMSSGWAAGGAEGDHGRERGEGEQGGLVVDGWSFAGSRRPPRQRDEDACKRPVGPVAEAWTGGSAKVPGVTATALMVTVWVPAGMLL